MTLRRNPLPLRWLLIAAYLVWLIFTISSYFVVNRPSLPQLPAVSSALPSLGHLAGALGRTALDMGAAAWIALAALSLGLWVWRRLAPEAGDTAGAIIFATSLGLGTLALATLALGLLGLLSRTVFLLLLSAMTVIGSRETLAALRRLRWQRPPTWVMAYLALILGMTLTVALLPPSSWDGLFYHLKGPKLYLQAGRISPAGDIPHLHFPSLFEMLLLAGMALRSDVAAKLLHFVYLLLLGGVVYLISDRLLLVKNSWLALLFLAATPLVLVVAGWAYNDLALAFYGLAALYALLRWQQDGQPRWPLLGGVFAGFMMGMKYTAIVPSLFFVAFIAWHGRRDLRRAMDALLRFGLPAAALVAPWLLKNWAFTGNPLYPFVFAGRYWDAFRAAEYADAGTGIGLDALAILRLPYDMTLGYADASQEGPIGPLYLIFLPLLLLYAFSALRKSAPPAFHAILAYAAALYLFWVVGVVNSASLWQARLLLPGIVALCPLLAWIWEDLGRFDQRHFSLRRFMRLVLLFVIALLTLAQARAWAHHYPPAYLLGAESRAEYLSRTLGLHYQVMEDLNRLLPEGAVIEFLWEPRSYYCDHDCRPDSILDRFEHLYHLHDSAEGIISNWRQNQITHILLFDSGLDFVRDHSDDPLTPGEAAALHAIRSRYLETDRSWHGGYTLYGLTERRLCPGHGQHC